jgi:hypothetical protein
MKTKILILTSLFIALFLNAQNFQVKDLEKIISLHNEDVKVALPILKKLKCKPEFKGDFQAPEAIAMNNQYKCPTIQEDVVLFSGMYGKVVAIYYIELDEKLYTEVENMLLKGNYTSTNEVEERRPDRDRIKVKVFTSKDKKPDAYKSLVNTEILLQQPKEGKFLVYIN